MTETLASALARIEEKQYDAELLEKGIERERLRHYGFAFKGKKMLIGEDDDIKQSILLTCFCLA